MGIFPIYFITLRILLTLLNKVFSAKRQGVAVGFATWCDCIFICVEDGGNSRGEPRSQGASRYRISSRDMNMMPSP